MNLGIALAPESRRDQGLCLNLGVGFNINLPIFDRLTIGPVVNAVDESQACRQADQGSADQNRLARGQGLEPVGRQPAEDRNRQVAQSRRQAFHFRRADRRRRRRHQGRNLPVARRAAAQWRRHHHDFFLSARGLRTRRPAARVQARRESSQATAQSRRARGDFGAGDRHMSGLRTRASASGSNWA